ncbi:Rieske 2Fe-2S domain-containing protein [Roseiarcaceae bacterium H3SJ34-1]|uniref:Rieske 2Fe-2S domain-containing protein n=1 Tax=Terripilifer ovatus TaxID=3032367 RepID=UPI003AB9A9ED|nr:Rieske 2Fe-2S domain-containing protein [Roseiarcaceae bacterium H3SJ34-1]
MEDMKAGDLDFAWPFEDVSRVPFQVYTDPAIYACEQERIFQGPTWNFLALEVEIPNRGDFKTTQVGEAPIIVVRTAEGEINAMVNRCAHKGSLICFKPRGNVKELACVYHNWVYDLAGNLTGVAFRRGVGGKGGLSEDFDQSQYGLQRLRVETYGGMIFGTFSDATPPFRDYIGAELMANIDRVFIKPLKVLGYHSQVLPNNWKLYAENNKDSYHASLLHVFHNTFGVVRPNMGGGIKLSDNGWHHLSYTQREGLGDEQVGREKVRSLKDQYRLQDASLMEHRLELGDTVTNAIQTVFPTLVVQQILNALAVRQLVPRGVDRSELIWTILGFEDDDADMQELRLKVNNLVGPAGLISMEDGCVGGWVQRAAKADPGALTVMPMGGRSIEASVGSRITEAAVRGFWQGWRSCMGV